MSTVTATCPLCHATREYGAELIGRYTLCQACRRRFYVQVPELDDGTIKQPGLSPATSAKPETTLDDLLWDTQQGTRYIAESLRNQERYLRATCWLVVGLLVLGVANLGLTLWLLR